MKAIVTPKQQKRALSDLVDTTVQRVIVDKLRDYQMMQDALWLRTLAITLGWRKKRLERIYRRFYEIRREDADFFCENSDERFEGVLESNAISELHSYGIEMRELFEDTYDDLIKPEFTGKARMK